MKTLLLIALFFSSSLFGVTLSELIDSSLSKSPSLEAINARIEANKHSIEVAGSFSNPELLLTTNTLESSEAMSQTVLTLKQKIPYYGKRDTKESVIVAEDALLKEQLKAAKVKLVALIKEEAYGLWELQELRKVVDAYIALTVQNIELYESYTSMSDNQHMGMMRAELSLLDLAIEKSSLNAKIAQAYARLSYLSASDVNDLEIALSIGKKPEFSKLQQDKQSNPQLLIKAQELKREQAKVELADVNNYPDFTLLAGYAYRENFDDYFNLGIGITLPIYGTEDAQEQEAKAHLLEVQSSISDTKLSVDANVNVYYLQMQSSYEIYHIVQDSALPQVEHMFELSSSSISTGSDLFKYIDVLFQKLSLEKKSIQAVVNYNKAEAKIAQLSGALK